MSKKQRLFEVMSKVDSSFKIRLVESNDPADILDYLMNGWSKKPDVINKIKSNKYLTQKYGKYLEFNENEWRQLSPEEITALNNSWYVDNQTIGKMNHYSF